jgi:hypothetical protein
MSPVRVLCVLLLVALVCPAADEPGFTFQLDRKDNKIGLFIGKECTTFEITAVGRTGRAEIAADKLWPTDMAIRFKNYADPALRREFRFHASNGKVTLGAGFQPTREGVQTNPDVLNPSVWWFDVDGKPLDGFSSRVRYIVTVEHDVKERTLRIVLPPDFCVPDTKALRLQWVMARD